MRYIVLKSTVSKVFDEILNETEEIIELLIALKEKEITCSVQIKSGPVFNFVRILKVDIDNSTFEWRLMKNGISLKKKTSINDINLLTIEVDNDMAVKIKPNPSRWSTIDTSEI